MSSDVDAETEALQAFRLRSGFRIELAACEPMVASPVALDFDEDGRLYVAEFRDFNRRFSEDPQRQGAIRLLEDEDGDGVYEKSAVYLDRVESPAAVCCFAGGVYIGSVPDILYAKDTDGDRRADIRRVVYTGFARDTGGEAMFNSFRWSFDNRIHVQTSRSGGEVRRSGDGGARAVSVGGQGFVFDPRTEEFALTSGGGQHGMSLDDWGNKFATTSHDPIFLVMYESRYLARNPFLDAPAAVVPISPGGYGTKVFRISPDEPWRVLRTRWRTTGIEAPHPTEGDQPSGYFSAASGVTIYRGDAWPAEYHGNAFVGEVSNNLVYRASLEPNGVGMTALRADPDVEFLASTDIWFRPVQFANAPDGTLYVLDMYRHLIEAVEFMSPEIVKHMDVSAGFDMGRIYRIVPENFHRRATPKLGSLSTVELVSLLEHANGWHRDTASRLLYERQDQAAVGPLKRLAAESRSPLGRMHALYALDGLRALDSAVIIRSLRDADSRVREHALRLAEQFAMDPKIRDLFASMTDDPDLRVRYQLAFSLGEVQHEVSSQALVRLALRDGADSWCQLALLSSVNLRAGDVFRLLIEHQAIRTSDHGREMLSTLAKLIGSENRQAELAAFARGLEALPATEGALRRNLVGTLVATLPASGIASLDDASMKSVRDELSDLLRDAVKTALDEERSVEDRVAAIRMLKLVPWRDVEYLLPQLLHFRQPQSVQAAAIDTLVHFDQPAGPAMLIDAWPDFSPQLCAGAVEAFLSRANWIDAFLNAVEQGHIRRGDVDAARMQSLQSHSDIRLRARAAKLFAGSTAERRQDVVAAYQEALQLAGDRQQGKALFKKECSACHQLEGVGTQVGADLTAIRSQGAEKVLLSILDPNCDVKPQFNTYVVTTDGGRIITGLITSETANSLTVRKADGASETVLRIHIETLQSTGMSFMPDGMEKQIDVRGMADLLAYLGSVP